MHLNLVKNEEYNNKFAVQVVEYRTLDEIFVNHGLT
jgi:hypothetical protein